MQIPEDKLRVALTHRSIETQRDKVLSPLTVEQARYARDAFAKAVYERMFTWLVERLNSSLENTVHTCMPAPIVCVVKVYIPCVYMCDSNSVYFQRHTRAAPF